MNAISDQSNNPSPVEVAAESAVTTHNVMVTTQLTSKKLKLHIILSSLIWWVGITWLLFAIAASASGEVSIGVPMAMSVVGPIWYFATKFRIWWNHK